VSTLRARCPDCRTLTAVAIGGDYQCHSCGREFGAGLVRVAGEPELELPWPLAATIDDPAALPPLPLRPLVVADSRAVHDAVAAVVDGYLLVGPDAREEELAALPRPAGAGFMGLGDAERVARLAHALGL
jgi:hypothetical protein